MKRVRAWCLKNLENGEFDLTSIHCEFEILSEWLKDSYGTSDIDELADLHGVKIVSVEINEVK